MSVLMVQACNCDRCGHVWLANNPKRCAKCKKVTWNMGAAESASAGERSPQPPSGAAFVVSKTTAPAPKIPPVDVRPNYYVPAKYRTGK